MIGNRLRELRKSLALNLNDFSDKVGISLSYLSEIENGKAKNIGLETFLRIIDVYKVNPLWLLYGKEPMFAAADDEIKNGIVSDFTELYKIDKEKSIKVTAGASKKDATIEELKREIENRNHIILQLIMEKYDNNKNIAETPLAEMSLANP